MTEAWATLNSQKPLCSFYQTVVTTVHLGCERLDLHQRFPVYETGEIATSLLRNKTGAGTQIRTEDLSLTRRLLWPTELYRLKL